MKPATTAFPLLVIPGMARSGTTYLYHALGDHPEIVTPVRKETNFFGPRYGRGPTWFASLFEETPRLRWAADISPTYFNDADCIDRIHIWNGPVRLVMGVRDPVDYAVSLYEHLEAIGQSVPDSCDFLQGFVQESHGGSFPHHFHPGALMGRVEEFLAAFGTEILIYDYAALSRSPLEVLERIEAFLELSPWFESSRVRTRPINARGSRILPNPIRRVGRESTYDTVMGLVPTRLLRRVRRLVDYVDAAVTRPRIADPSKASLAHHHLREDQERYRAMFRSSSFVVGNDTGATRTTKEECTA